VKKSLANQTCALIQFESANTLKRVYKILAGAGSTSSPILNESREPLSFGLAYDTRSLGENAWVGVVIRNLPANANDQGIKTKLSNYEALDFGNPHAAGVSTFVKTEGPPVYSSEPY
jgi:hypothetical protein